MLLYVTKLGKIHVDESYIALTSESVNQEASKSANNSVSQQVNH